MKSGYGSLFLCFAVACSNSSVATTSLEGIDDLTIVGFSVSPDGHAWVATEAALYSLGVDKLIKIGSPQASPTGGKLVALSLFKDRPILVSGDVLYSLTHHTFDKWLEVPIANVKIASTEGLVYFFGQSVYVFDPAKGSQALFDVSSEVDCAVAAGGKLYFSIGPTIYSFALGEKLTALAVVPGIERITSMAFDAHHCILYLSAGECVYALLIGEAQFIMLAKGDKEWLAFEMDTLFILSPLQRKLYRVHGLSQRLTEGRIPLRLLK